MSLLTYLLRELSSSNARSLHFSYTVFNYIATLCSGGASAVKEPGHFEVRKSSSQVTRMHFFPQEKLTTFFSCRPQNTGRQRRFTVKIKQIKRSDMVTILFSVHTITEAKQYAGIGRAEPGLSQGGGSSSQVIWPGAPWCSAATAAVGAASSARIFRCELFV